MTDEEIKTYVIEACVAQSRDAANYSVGLLKDSLYATLRDTASELSEKFSKLSTDCHNFADEWTRKIETLESSVDPMEVRKELASLLADFVRLSK